MWRRFSHRTRRRGGSKPEDQGLLLLSFSCDLIKVWTRILFSLFLFFSSSLHHPLFSLAFNYFTQMRGYLIPLFLFRPSLASASTSSVHCMLCDDDARRTILQTWPFFTQPLMSCVARARGSSHTNILCLADRPSILFILSFIFSSLSLLLETRLTDDVFANFLI